MSKVVIFGHISPNFFDDLFLGIPKLIFFVDQYFSHIPNKASPAYYFFCLFRPKKLFFRLYRPKNCILDLKACFLDFLDLKISLNPLKTLRKLLFSHQIDEKNNIFF